MGKGGKGKKTQNQSESPVQQPQHSKSTDPTEEIRLLKKRVDELTKRVVELESFQQVSSKVTETLKKEVDRLDQYGRRHSVVIRNIEKPPNETQEQVEAKVNALITTTLKSPHLTKDVDKLHRIGRPKKQGRKTFQNIVVRFRSHRSRYALYNKKKELKDGVKINAHLTTYRAKLLHESIEFTKDIEGVDFTYSNIHGDLYVWFTEPDENGTQKVKFDSMDELSEILLQKGLVEEEEEE